MHIDQPALSPASAFLQYTCKRPQAASDISQYSIIVSPMVSDKGVTICVIAETDMGRQRHMEDYVVLIYETVVSSLA